MRNTITTAILVFLLAGLTFIAPAVAGDVNDHQIRICHATGSETNPYVTPTPAKQQISRDHGHKSGQGVHPGDIIPPFPAGSKGSHDWDAFPGMNWDATGQAIWKNDCRPVEETPPTTGPPTITPTEPTGTPHAPLAPPALPVERDELPYTG